MAPETSLRGPARLLVGPGDASGVLELADGRFAMTIEGGRVFEAPVGEVKKVADPWYYFGGGCKITIGDKTHRVFFVRPSSAADVPGALPSRADPGPVGDGLGPLTAGRKIVDFGSDRKAGKAWKRALPLQG